LAFHREPKWRRRGNCKTCAAVGSIGLGSYNSSYKGREGDSRKGQRSSWEMEGRRGEGAAELQQWRCLLQLDGRGEKCVFC